MKGRPNIVPVHGAWPLQPAAPISVAERANTNADGAAVAGVDGQ